MKITPDDHAAYEMELFRHAAYFTVVRPGFAKKEFKDFAEAALAAASVERAILYAVTAQGRSVVLVRNRWAEYLAVWRQSRGLATPPLPVVDLVNACIGDSVYHVDPRHVGKIMKFYQSGVALIEWENGWHSYVHADELTKVKEE